MLRTSNEKVETEGGVRKTEQWISEELAGEEQRSFGDVVTSPEFSLTKLAYSTEGGV
ncbi:MAG: hypothetical protein Q4C47_05000 [Planctomycetia bacterium]|nr:hypothetical protein [Planctomycetia bacterium]